MDVFVFDTTFLVLEYLYFLIEWKKTPEKFRFKFGELKIRFLFSRNLKQPLSDVLNPFVSNAPFLYRPKTSENLTVFWCFQGVE